MPPSKLYPFEWGVVLVFVGSILALSIYSWAHSEVESVIETGQVAWICPPLVTITVSGAVKNPGDYQVNRGTTIEEAVKKAEPLIESDLSRLALKATIQKKRKIFVPYKKKKLRNIPTL